MLDLSTVLKHYKRKEIQEEIIKQTENREVVAFYKDHFGQRPNILRYPQEILYLAQEGATSFHASEERWLNPLELGRNLSKEEMDNLRIGWDLVLDIDCQILEYSKIAAWLIIQFFKENKIKSLSCKFSGNKGFHLGIPFEAFPHKYLDKEMKFLFPLVSRKIAFYLKEMIKKPLGEEILKFEKNDFSRIVRKTNKKPEEIKFFVKDKFGTRIPFLNVEPFLEIDTVLLSPRHLYRLPYSLHEKSGLVSLPIDLETVFDFEKKIADPEKMEISKFTFLQKKGNEDENEKMLHLLRLAFDYQVKRREIKPISSSLEIKSQIKEEYFPPCIRLILNGLEDGRKRSLFVLINFLSSLNWPKEEIISFLKEWNSRNKEPLPENYFQSQLNYHLKNGEKILPPNCQKEGYYKSINVCFPDQFCSKIKNPVNYALLKFKRKEKTD